MKEQSQVKEKERTYINNTAETLCDKLEALNVAAIPITPLKILAVQVEVRASFDFSSSRGTTYFLFQTLFAAWQSESLASKYLLKMLEKLTAKMAEIEAHELTPPGWRAVWDRYGSPFFFHLLHILLS